MTKKKYLSELDEINAQAELLQIKIRELKQKTNKTKFKVITPDLDEAYDYCSNILENFFAIEGYVNEN